MIKREGHIHLHETSIGIWEENVNETSFRTVYQAVVRHLMARGFRTVIDPNVKKNYPELAQYRHVAKKGLLEAHMGMSGRHIEVEFFQNVNIENSNGGRYDFNKFQRMPYLVRKQFIIEAGKLLDSLIARFEYVWDGNTVQGNTTSEIIINTQLGINPSQEPLRHFNDRWASNRFTRDETGWPIAKEYDHGSNKDREGIHLRNGMFRYYRDRYGYLKRGLIYTNMNTMWHIIYGPGRNDSTWVSCHELFTLQPGDPRGRHFSESKRRSILDRELNRAIKDQRFEQAAILRDLLKLQLAA
jgi:hypothetical protein